MEALDPVADIWATVELERALREHDRPIDLAETATVDPLLGANVVLIAADGGRPLALAEPISEGRLAAALARHGEGRTGQYVAVPEGDTVDAYRRRAQAAGVAVSRVEPGPFGLSVLVLVRPVTGPHLIVVERRSLPSRA